jgi:hypothetical protein
VSYLQGLLAPEHGALFLRAFEAGRDALREREESFAAADAERLRCGFAGPHEPRRRPSSAVALVAVTDLALSGPNVHAGGERDQVILHVDRDSGPLWRAAPRVAPETAERLFCDASLAEVVDERGTPLSVGRKRRTVPPAIQRALRSRDRGCRFPGCENRRFLDAHHVQHWARGGETRLANLVLLCRRCHRLLHEGGYAVELRATARRSCATAGTSGSRRCRGCRREFATRSTTQHRAPRACRPATEIRSTWARPRLRSASSSAEALDSGMHAEAVVERQHRDPVAP